VLVVWESFLSKSKACTASMDKRSIKMPLACAILSLLAMLIRTDAHD
jgi:hypothetical protein